MKHGDNNTRYNSVIKQKRLNQTIFQIQNDNKQIQYDHENIAEIFVKYYKNLLGEMGG